MTQLKMLSTDDKLTEIRRLYFKASKQTVQQDLAKALDLLKSMESEDDRERATVFMEGLAEMQRDWLKTAGKKPGKPGRPGAAKKAGGAGKAGKAGGTAAGPRKPGRPGGPGAAKKAGSSGRAGGAAKRSKT